MHWVRRHQRSFARLVLALFCLAWLQAAFVPCTMAAPAMQDCEHHCPYCPSDTDGTLADHASGCAYPHEPQADGRAAAMFAIVLAPAEVLAPARRQGLISGGRLGAARRRLAGVPGPATGRQRPGTTMNASR